MEFERFECISNPNGPYKNTTCQVKKVGWRNLKVNIAAYLTRPITDIQVNTVMYYKYSKYQRFPVNIWENICDALSGKSESHSFNWMFKPILQYPNTTTNWGHLCPFDGFVYLRAPNIPLDILPFIPLVPSGQYMFDLGFYEANRTKYLGTFKMFVAISDHRVEKY